MLNLHFTPEEESAILMIEKEKAVRSAALHSARFLQLWFRMQRQKKQGSADKITVAMRHELHQLKTAFKRCKDAAFVDYDDMVDDGSKIDSLAGLTKYMKEAAGVVKLRTAPDFSDGVADGYDSVPRVRLSEAQELFAESAKREVTRRAQALQRAKEQGFAGNEDGLKKFNQARQKLKRHASLATLLNAKEKEVDEKVAVSSFAAIVEKARMDARNVLCFFYFSWVRVRDYMRACVFALS